MYAFDWQKANRNITQRKTVKSLVSLSYTRKSDSLVKSMVKSILESLPGHYNQRNSNG